MAHEKVCGEFAKLGPSIAELENFESSGSLTLVFFKHASGAVVFNGQVIYFDPINQYVDCTKLPKAAAILVTHSHSDHLDKAAVSSLTGPGTKVFGSKSCSDVRGLKVVKPGDVFEAAAGVSVKAVPAYNAPARAKFHPKERQDTGFLVTAGGTVVYIPSDCEPMPEHKSLGKVDIAMLPVNQPYTMTVEQALEAVKAIKPQIFIPIHFEAAERTDVTVFEKLLAGSGITYRYHNMP